MKRLATLLGFVAVLALAGCGSSEKSANDVGQTYVTTLDRVADALESVKDEASAKKAASEIAKANDVMQSMVDEINSMSRTEQVMMVQKNAAKMAEAEMRISQAMQKIVSDNPQLLDVIGSEIQDMPKLK